MLEVGTLIPFETFYISHTLFCVITCHLLICNFAILPLHSMVYPVFIVVFGTKSSTLQSLFGWKVANWHDIRLDILKYIVFTFSLIESVLSLRIRS